jgi:hypothetical protein
MQGCSRVVARIESRNMALCKGVQGLQGFFILTEGLKKYKIQNE